MANDAVTGRAMIVGGNEFPCAARNVTLETMELIAEASVDVGQVVICYLNDIGILPGTITKLLPGGFMLALAIPVSRRQRVAARLEWFGRRAHRIAELRGAPRIVPIHRIVQVRLGENLVMSGLILDISLSGAAIALKTQALPFIGAKVRVGSRYASVARLLEQGIAVQFDIPFASEDFDEHVKL